MIVGEDAVTGSRASDPDSDLEDSRAPAATESPRRNEVGAPASAWSVRILLVDDDEVDRIAVRRALGDSGLEAEIREARTVEDARRALRTHPFDCALVDYYLPDGQGVDVLRAATEGDVTVPVIMLTGQGDEHLAVDLMKEGARDYIPKNALSVSRLSQSIRHILEIARAEREARRTREGQRFLAEASQELAQSLDHEATVERVAALAVPRIADHCFVEVRTPEGTLERAASAHVEGAGHDPPELADGGSGGLVRRVVETGEPLVVGGGGAGDGPDGSEDPPPSVLVAPLVARGRTLGVLMLVSTSLERRYDEHDLLVAQSLANRAALAMDNARLYEKARRAVAARDEMLGVVSHDLRNPLNVIAAAAGLVLDIPLPEEKKTEQLGMIKRATDRMDRLIQDLLDVTGIEAGRFSVEPAPEEPGELLRDAHEMMEPLFDDKGVGLELEAPASSLPRVRADRERIVQVFSNLLGNALKFTPPEGRVRMGARSENGDSVRFFVDDTGPGIAEEDLPHLFDRFWSGSRSGHAGEGTGLGLPIAKGIVEVHEGTISVESEVGAGTRISFTLPSVREAGDAG